MAIVRSQNTEARARTERAAVRKYSVSSRTAGHKIIQEDSQRVCENGGYPSHQAPHAALVCKHVVSMSVQVRKSLNCTSSVADIIDCV